MNSRKYESELKALLEKVANIVCEYDEVRLYDLHLPSNVAGVKPISVLEWIEARKEKRQRN